MELKLDEHTAGDMWNEVMSRGDEPGFAALLEESEREMVVPKEGAMLTGVVVGRGPDEILVDVGAKSEAVVRRKEMMRGQDLPELGAQVRLYVLEPENDLGQLL